MEQKTLSAIERRISQNPPLFKLAGYNALDKVHKKQMEFHMCLKRNRWVFRRQPHRQNRMRRRGSGMVCARHTSLPKNKQAYGRLGGQSYQRGSERRRTGQAAVIFA